MPAKAKTVVMMRIDSEVYATFKQYCIENGFVIGKWMEKTMRDATQNKGKR